VQPEVFIFPDAFILSIWWVENLINIIKVPSNSLLNILHAYKYIYSMHLFSLISFQISLLPSGSYLFSNLYILNSCEFLLKQFLFFLLVYMSNYTVFHITRNMHAYIESRYLWSLFADQCLY